MKPTNAVGFATVLTTALSKEPERRPDWAVDPCTRNQSLKRVKLHFISDYGCVKPDSHIEEKNWLSLPEDNLFSVVIELLKFS